MTTTTKREFSRTGPANCRRCGARLYKTYDGDFPNCVTCGWEDYSPPTTPVQMRGSSIESLRYVTLTRIPRSRRQGSRA